MARELEKRYRVVVIILGVLILILSGALCAFGSEVPEDSQELNRGMPTGSSAQTIYIEKEVEVTVEVERVVVETIILTEDVVEPTFDCYEYVENYFTKQAQIQEHWSNCSLSYPTATYVWQYLVNDLGYSDYVAAGIIGNMMNECGGNTLTLRWDEHGGNNGYYGLCMWSLKYHANLDNTNIDQQLAYLADSIRPMFNQYGYLYKKGFTYEDFCNLTDSQAAALAFMKVYERPGPASTNTRQVNALKAYQFFVIN